jgi:uncharacterized SAM-binding protein YcdF (DUF218 family)
MVRRAKKQIIGAPKHPVRHAVIKVLQFLTSFALTLLLCGFIAFVLHVSRTTPPSPLPTADGIVVLTGKGGGRLSAGAELLRSGHGERLLISGVNPAIGEEKMQSLLELEDDIYTCCVDLDYEAENTYDNAQETANWARALGYENILLVTSSYHMPRSKIEISTAMDGIVIIPYPVKAEPAEDEPWWGGKDKNLRLLREYGKLLITYAREPGRRPKAKSTNAEANSQ